VPWNDSPRPEDLVPLVHALLEGNQPRAGDFFDLIPDPWKDVLPQDRLLKLFPCTLHLLYANGTLRAPLNAADRRSHSLQPGRPTRANRSRLLGIMLLARRSARAPSSPTPGVPKKCTSI
jgi:hypothetical protein